ncbi:MAG: hypothetical protein R3A51_01740 [Nannocystaceae bacterium]
MRKASIQAARKPKRGGAPNVLFVRASVEALPEALTGVADEITIHLPWGSLLAALVRPDPEVLSSIAALGRPGCRLRAVFGYSEASDPGEQARLELPALTAAHRAALRRAYQAAGFEGVALAPVERAELAALETSWARRLRFGQDRTYLGLVARRYQ